MAMTTTWATSPAQRIGRALAAAQTFPDALAAIAQLPESARPLQAARLRLALAQASKALAEAYPDPEGIT